MQVSFGNPENTAPAPAIEVETKTVDAPAQTAIATPEIPVPAAAPSSPEQATTAIAKVSSGPLGPSGVVLGDKIPDASDIILPHLNIVQNIGGLKETFPAGALVFGQQTVLWSPPEIDKNTGAAKGTVMPPVNLTVLGFRPTRFVEKVVGGVRGMICNTEAQVVANGGTLSYAEWNAKKADGMKLFQPLAEAWVLIERPAHIADDDTVFVYPVTESNGTVRKFALAVWSMKGTAYTEAAKKVFFTARGVGCLRKGYPTHSYSVTTKLKKYEGGNSAWVPICLPASKSSEAFLALVGEILNAPAQ